MGVHEIIPPAFWKTEENPPRRTKRNQPVDVQRVGWPQMSAVLESQGDYRPDLYSAAAYDPRTHTIGLNPAYSDDESNYPHETGHVMYDTGAIPAEIMEQWNHIHASELRKRELNPNYLPLASVERYPDDPTHSFAETVGQYVGYPERFEATKEWIYRWMRSVMGREYKTRDAAEAQSPAAHVPFYWGVWGKQ